MGNGIMEGRLSAWQGRFLLKIARLAIMKELHLPISAEEELERDFLGDQVFQERLGVFVTLHLEGRLRGCIGSLVGTCPIIEGVRQNAINAAFNDSRFRQVTPAEIEKIDIELSVLSEPRLLAYDNVDDLVSRLRPGVDGIIIRQGSSSATFLPQVWRQLPDVAAFMSHLCQKAGLAVDEWIRGKLEVRTYQVQSFAEKDFHD